MARRFQFSLRTLFGVLTLAAVIMAYVGSYYHLSRRGLREAKAQGMEGFLCVPVAEAFATKDLSKHYFRARIYAPLNWVDQEVFGGEGPIGGILWELSKRGGINGQRFD